MFFWNMVIAFMGLVVKNRRQLVLDKRSLIFYYGSLLFLPTWWLSWTQSKYSNWSLLLPGWVSRWWNTDVTSLNISSGQCLATASVLKWCCVLVWPKALKCYLASPFFHEVLNHSDMMELVKCYLGWVLLASLQSSLYESNGWFCLFF